MPEPAPDHRPVIVAGLGRLGLRIVEQLRARGLPVRIITESGCPGWHIRMAREAGAVLFTGDFRDPESWALAGAEECQAAVITSASDSRNLETSIRVKRLVPGLRIVTRVDAPHLGHRLHRDFGLHAALCPADLCAAQVVKIALDNAQGPPPLPVRRARTAGRHEPSAQFLVLGLLVSCLLAGTMVFHFFRDMPWMNAAYFTVTILTTVGFGDYHLHRDPGWMQAFGMLLMLAGVTLIALLVSFFSHFLITGEASRHHHEQAARRFRGHFIVAGMGSLGHAVVRALQKRGERVVCIELNHLLIEGDATLHGVPVIDGDATLAETLLRAGIDRARAVLAVTSADGTNLEIALRARSLTDAQRTANPLPVVISCQDDLLGGRLRTADNAYLPFSSAEFTAPFFVHAAVQGDRPAS